MNVSRSSYYDWLNNLEHERKKFKTREEAKYAIFEYIEVFYNRIRIHSTNDYLSLVDYEAMRKYA